MGEKLENSPQKLNKINNKHIIALVQNTGITNKLKTTKKCTALKATTSQPRITTKFQILPDNLPQYSSPTHRFHETPHSLGVPRINRFLCIPFHHFVPAVAQLRRLEPVNFIECRCVCFPLIFHSIPILLDDAPQGVSLFGCPNMLLKKKTA